MEEGGGEEGGGEEGGGEGEEESRGSEFISRFSELGNLIGGWSGGHDHSINSPVIEKEKKEYFVCSDWSALSTDQRLRGLQS